MTVNLSDAIDALLPQTQCGLCGYGGCRPYAQALAAGAATVDRCPPGGVKTLYALAAVLGVDPKPYEAQVAATARPPATAMIHEEDCIGCTKCIQACPVDAIVGAAQWMHTIVGQECTGCGLCVEPCPVDCIELVKLPESVSGEQIYDANLARARYEAKQIRLLKTEQSRAQHYREKKRLSGRSNADLADKASKQAYILEAMTRAAQAKTGRKS